MELAYYANNGLLEGLTQKNRSAVVSTLWEVEPNQNKWALIGTAFTVLRDSMRPNQRAGFMDFMAAIQQGLTLAHKDEVLKIFGYDLSHQNSQVHAIENGKPDFDKLIAHGYVGTLSVTEIVLMAWEGGFQPSLKHGVNETVTNDANVNAQPNATGQQQLFAATNNGGAMLATTIAPPVAGSGTVVHAPFPALPNIAFPGHAMNLIHPFINAHVVHSTFDIYAWASEDLDNSIDQKNDLEYFPEANPDFDGILFDV